MLVAMAAIFQVPALVWAQVIAYSGFGKFVGCFADYNFAIPGDDGLRVRSSGDMAERSKYFAAQIAYGRIVLIAIVGIYFQDGRTGSAYSVWALFTGSPLRAFLREAGVQALAGSWGLLRAPPQ